MRNLLNWAKGKALDVIFIQEHNLGVHKAWKHMQTS